MKIFVFVCFCYFSIIFCLLLVGFSTVLFLQALVYFLSEILCIPIPNCLRRILKKC